jgi:PKD repeat protein
MKSLILFAVLIFPMLMSAQTVNFTGKVNSNLSIQYFDASDFEGSSWLWKFGDGQTSTVRNPIHTYVSPGTYSVCLKVDSNTEVCKTDVFTVTESGLEINYDNTIWTRSKRNLFLTYSGYLHHLVEKFESTCQKIPANSSNQNSGDEIDFDF